eukprot:TRINITY_DN120625_c1_g1_i1.p1 TRINITY_DN120625_c1_g1~~TRINITY_DN120625_c1_g1_i1.p1  ORF type:complete len:259 (+),score=12.84 TRINITY_DN120625_c1_g1_i1:455-1231(+)
MSPKKTTKVSPKFRLRKLNAPLMQPARGSPVNLLRPKKPKAPRFQPSKTIQLERPDTPIVQLTEEPPIKVESTSPLTIDPPEKPCTPVLKEEPKIPTPPIEYLKPEVKKPKPHIVLCRCFSVDGVLEPKSPRPMETPDPEDCAMLTLEDLQTEAADQEPSHLTSRNEDVTPRSVPKPRFLFMSPKLSNVKPKPIRSLKKEMIQWRKSYFSINKLLNQNNGKESLEGILKYNYAFQEKDLPAGSLYHQASQYQIQVLLF